MLEGLLHGLIGGALASVGLWAWNTQWTSGVREFPEGSGFAALVVTDGYDKWVMLVMLLIGALAGAIGSGIAASRFLDV
jgi:cell division transport system permease protein